MFLAYYKYGEDLLPSLMIVADVTHAYFNPEPYSKLYWFYQNLDKTVPNITALVAHASYSCYKLGPEISGAMQFIVNIALAHEDLFAFEFNNFYKY